MNVLNAKPPSYLEPARWLARLAVIAIVLASVGCYRAPTLTGSDQVYDPNIEATKLKDNDLGGLVWPEVDAVMDTLLPDPNDPGCAIGIARGGELIYLEGYGKAVIGGANWSVATMGAVGSISKTLTAAAALKMHQQGLIDVNQTVGSYLATSNGPLGSTAIHELMNHSGGVGGATQALAFGPTWEGGSPASECVVIDPGEEAACANASQLAARPEMAFGWYEGVEAVENLPKGDPASGIPHDGVYSNVGYSALGAVIDDAAQSTSSGGYEAWVWDEIGIYTGNLLSADNLLSLALSHSWRNGDIPYRARGYTPNGAGFDLFEAFAPGAVDWFEGWEGPSGGWVMTIGDLTRLAVAVQEDAILGGLEDAMRFEWTELLGWNNDLYGMGMFLNQNGARPPQWHGGAIGGHRANWGVWDNYAGTGQSLAVAMMCNRTDIVPWNQANVIAAATVGSSPRPGQIQFGAPVEESALDDRTFALDWDAAWQEVPRGATLPFVLGDALVLNTSATRRGFEASLVAFEREEDRLTRPLGKSQWLGALDLGRDNTFSTERRDVILETSDGEIVLEDLVTSGRVGPGGRSLADVGLSFSLDTRQIERFDLDWNAVCQLAEETGARCKSCRDGETACLAVEYRSLRGEAVEMDRR